MRKVLALDEEVAAIGELPREELVNRWIKAHGHPPPIGVRNGLLIYSATWQLQARRLGGFKPETKRRLKEAMRQLEDRIGGKQAGAADPIDDGSTAADDTPPIILSASPTRKRQILRPGARLLREWNGQTHVVDVIENGFVHEAKVYRSLTAIARAITGTHWSGPRFFGI
ncbi:DUF2924 domain-containing protein [Pseudochelatococcus lubricantis]|uniref:DUF2924 domain-containing protein n=1 Tax=Pseudochelatococcus lubricantis TaxID=1538102 RepID=UPI0035EEE116